MKVLFISGGDYKYGAPKSMLTLIEGLKEQCNVEIILLTKKRNPLNEYCDRHGIENYYIWYRDIMAGSPYSNKILTLAKHSVKYLAFLCGVITMNRINNLPIDFKSIDIVHTNTNRQDIGVSISSKYGIKHIWHIREMGKEDYNVLIYKRNCISYMNKSADAFIMISNAVKNKWLEAGIDPLKVYTIYDGMDTDKVTASPKINWQNKQYIKIVITGHIQPNKGQLHLVNAIAALPMKIRNKIKLDIIGEAYPDYKKKIESEIARFNMQDQIHLLGYMDTVYDRLPEYDIGITCSKAEGLGRCTIEYMLSGLLVIASNTGANPELIQDKSTGLLYQYGNIGHLTHTILWAIEHPEECQTIAHAGFTSSASRFAKEQYAKDIYQIYENCLNQPPHQITI